VDKPYCKICDKKHYGTCAENMATAKPKRDAPKQMTAVTPKAGLKIRPHCPTCVCQRKLSHAERQRAYRERKSA
jgi:hypothetical protein